MLCALGAGGKADPCQLHLGRLTEVINDPIATTMLRTIRKKEAAQSGRSGGGGGGGDGGGGGCTPPCRQGLTVLSLHGRSSPPIAVHTHTQICLARMPQ